MKGRIWLILGVVAGVAMALGHLAYLAGAADGLAATAVRLVDGAGAYVVSSAAHHGFGRRLVEGIAAVFAVLAPGVAAVLLVVAARAAFALRVVVGLALLALGAASYLYQPSGLATGELVLAAVVAAVAVVATGPLLAAPLAALAGLLGGTYLPRLISSGSVARGVVEVMHQALYARPGDPTALQLALVVVAVLPFFYALRLVLARS